MDSMVKGFVNAFIRVIVYGVVMVAAVLVIHQDAGLVVNGLHFSEQSYTEYLQEILLFVTAIFFLLAGARNPNVKGFSIAMSGVALLAFIREFDWLLDEVVHGFWKFPALAVLLIVAFLVFKKKEQFLPAVNDFIKRPSWGVLLAGFLIVFVFSRLFGKSTFWKELMDENYIRSVKNAAEEGIELLGYALIMISSVEFWLDQKKK
ncbi:hypothetical protein EYV94_03545 [Puteibacter caeruleilacunae]|nr:hypothetical protein EYV94_03545 [Puteibacter caeruleilacunae]